MRTTPSLLISLLGASLLLAACGSTPDRRALHLPPPESAQDTAPPVVRVALPMHIDHRSLRVRTADQRVRALSGESWAEPPVAGFERLLGEQLAARAALPPPSRVEVRFTRFEREADGVFRAHGHWQIAPKEGAPVAGRVRFERTLERADAGALVAAMSDAVRATADAIVEATGAR